MENVRAALSTADIFSDCIGVYQDKLANFLSFYPKNINETSQEYEDRLLKNVKNNAFHLDGEDTVRVTRGQIIIDRVLYGEGRGGGFIGNTEGGRNAIYDNLNLPWSSVEEYVENQLLGCIYKIEKIISSRDRFVDQEFLFVFYKNIVRAYEVKDEFYIRPGEILAARLMIVKSGALSLAKVTVL